MPSVNFNSDPWAVDSAAKWLWLPVAGINMDKINVAGFYLLGARIQPLLTIKAGESIADLIAVFAEADYFLDLLINNAASGPKIEESRPLAEELQRP